MCTEYKEWQCRKPVHRSVRRSRLLDRLECNRCRGYTSGRESHLKEDLLFYCENGGTINALWDKIAIRVGGTADATAIPVDTKTVPERPPQPMGVSRWDTIFQDAHWDSNRRVLARSLRLARQEALVAEILSKETISACPLDSHKKRPVLALDSTYLQRRQAQ